MLKGFHKKLSKIIFNYIALYFNWMSQKNKTLKSKKKKVYDNLEITMVRLY
jgi:hypothetical protein